MGIGIVYRVGRKVLGVLATVARSERALMAEVLAPRQGNAVLRRQVARVRHEPTERAWFAALSASGCASQRVCTRSTGAPRRSHIDIYVWRHPMAADLEQGTARAAQGMHFDASLDCWVVDGYAEAVAVMREPALEIPLLPLPAAHLADSEQATLTPLWKQAMDTPLYSSGKAHRRLRAQLRGPFTHDAVDRWRPTIRRVADAAIDACTPCGKLEVIEDVAGPLLRQVMAEVVGIPQDRRAEFDLLANASMDAGKLATPQWSSAVLVEAARAVEQLGDLVHDLLGRADELPTGSVLARAAARRGADGGLSESELATNVRSLYTSGVYTTVFLVASAAYLLFCDEDVLREARRDDTVIRGVVHETLRYACPAVETNIRRATRDISIGMHTIRRGQFVRTAVLYANRDPQRFDAPDLFDHRRPSQGPALAYGVGPHVCLGNHLATAVAEEVLRALAQPRRDVRLDTPHPTFHRRAAIPVMWGPDRVHLKLGPN